MPLSRVKSYPVPPDKLELVPAYLKKLYRALSEESAERLSDPMHMGDVGSLTVHGRLRGIAGNNAADADFDTDDVAVTEISDTDGGMVVVNESVGGNVAVFFIQAGVIAAGIFDILVYSTTKDTAGLYNVYFETNVLKVQNKVGNNKSIKIAFYGV